MREGWKIRTLGEIATIYDHLRKPITKSDRKAGPYPYYGASGVQDHVEGYIFDGRYLLVGEDGAKWGPGDKSAYIVEGKCWVNNHAHILQLNGIKDTLVAYLFAFRDLGPYITGAIVPKMTQQALRSIPIPVPPIAEQEKIVAELDCLTGIIEKKKQQLEELEKLAQSIFYDMFGDPITNEKGWEVKEISSLFDVGSSKRVFEAQWRDKGVPFYRAREIVRLAKGEPIEDPIFVEEALYKEYSVKYGVPRPNDMMITGVGTLGVCYIVKAGDRFYFKDGNILWLKQKGLCETRFIKEQYATDYVMNQIKGNANIVTVGTYTITNANKTKVIVPPLGLQKQFVNKLEAIDRQKELVKRSIVETETLFNSRMDFWFNN